MSNPVDTITAYLHKYLWPTEAQPEIKPEVKKTDEKVQKVKKDEEPSWGNVYKSGGCTE